MAGQSSSIKIRTKLLNGLFLDIDNNEDKLDEVGDVENTKIRTNDTFIITIDLDEPDPAIVDSKNVEESKDHRLIRSGRC